MFKRLLRQVGIEITVSRYPAFESFYYYLKLLDVDVILDVGANEGQFAEELRCQGYNGRIISFEPLPDAFAILNTKALKDPKWDCYNLAIGDSNATAELQVSRNTVFSSLLAPSKEAAEVGYDVDVVSQVPVSVNTLDHLWPSLACDGRKVLLKIDTQGSEPAVLRGASGSLPFINGIRLELPLRTMYNDQLAIEHYLPLLRTFGMHLVELVKVCRSPNTGELLEMDGLFVRSTQQE